MRKHREYGKIITEGYAKKLIRKGAAGNPCQLAPDELGRVYVAIDRYDLQVIDHYQDAQNRNGS